MSAKPVLHRRAATGNLNGEVSASPLLLPPRRIPPAFSLFVATYRYTIAEHHLRGVLVSGALPYLKDILCAGAHLAGVAVGKSGLPVSPPCMGIEKAAFSMQKRRPM